MTNQPKRLKRRWVDPNKKKPRESKPRIWTPEKIAEEKEKKRLEREAKEQEKLDAKISLHQKLRPKETKEILKQQALGIQEKERHKEEIRKVVGLQITNNLITPNCDHLYKLSAVVSDKAIIACSKCSASSEMDLESWQRYVRKHRKEL